MATTAPAYVAPNSINYTDVKPQAMENKIQLCKYMPTGPVNGLKGGDMIKYMLSGNGFLDPYSTYFQFTVIVDDLLVDEMRFLDRSAHSFISRLVIRSQGTEIERIENYDVIAAMINDMIYSPEQCTQHYWEGFPTNTVDPVYDTVAAPLASAESLPPLTNNMQPIAAIGDSKKRPRCQERDEIARWLSQGGSPSTWGYVGEVCFHNLSTVNNIIPSIDGGATQCPLDTVFLVDYTLYYELTGSLALPISTAASPLTAAQATIGQSDPANVFYPLSWGSHQSGLRIPATNAISQSSATPRGTTTMQFMIPIYSGILGLLMPEKKLLPLNLLPIEIELVLNPYALYSSHSSGRRTYKVTEFNLYGNTFFFESEIHRTLEASVADHGLFIYCNGFLSAPIQNIATQVIPVTNNIQMNLKSINSVHWVFMYSAYEQSPCARKLHFVSHNVTKMQLLNGVQLMPQYPVEGNSGSSNQGQHLPFLIELYKAWNKLHDPARDGALNAYNICGDGYYGQFDPYFQQIMTSLRYAAVGAAVGYLPNATGGIPREGFQLDNHVTVKWAIQQMINKQANVGRSQYAISLEGEELGSERTMITGRKAQYPFQIQMWGVKNRPRVSYMMPFFRADYIVFIRPDLQIVVLGK